MKLGLFTPVFGKLTFKEMLAKVRALGRCTAIELGTGGWPGSDHHRRRRAARQQGAAPPITAQMIADAGLTISALSCHGNPLHPDRADGARPTTTCSARRVRLAEQLDVPVVVTFSGCPGDSDDARASELGDGAVAAGVSRGARLAVGEEGDSLLARRVELRRRPRRQGRARGASRASSSTTSTARCRLRARAPAPNLGVNFDPSHFFWQGVDVPTAIRALGDSIFHVHAKDVALDPQNVAVNGVIDTKTLSADGGAIVAVPQRRLGPRRARMEAASSARCG